MKTPSKKTVLLVANGDLRPSANETCWPAQAAMEKQLAAAQAELSAAEERWLDLEMLREEIES